MLRAAVIVLLTALLPSHTRAESRIALLIANQAYDPAVGALRNAHNDIAVVGQAMSKRSFEVLPPIKDAKRVMPVDALALGARKLKIEISAFTR
jgi:hypothetical protein